MSNPYSARRLWAVMVKEFVQMRRDRLTFAMMVAIPILQLVLFGFAINSDPKALPTAVLQADTSIYSRTFLHALENSGYFRIVRQVTTEEQAERAMALGQQIGVFFLIVLMSFVFYNDLTRIFGS